MLTMLYVLTKVHLKQFWPEETDLYRTHFVTSYCVMSNKSRTRAEAFSVGSNRVSEATTTKKKSEQIIRYSDHRLRIEEAIP